MLNIAFSSTRQWNPGDEFILRGVRSIFRSLGVAHNAHLFNRHPDIRAPESRHERLRSSHLSAQDLLDPEAAFAAANLRYDFFDNSIGGSFDYTCLDLAVFAGTPEWCGPKLPPFYAGLRQAALPAMFLGVGGGCTPASPEMAEVIAKAAVFTVRDAATLAEATAQGFAPQLLPCPALYAAPAEAMRTVLTTRRVALIFQASAQDSVIWNGCSVETADFIEALYTRLIFSHPNIDFAIVCHCASEVPLARSRFRNLPVLYSFDSADYGDIYAPFDAVIGPRVHGIGLAASLGIPGLAIVHDSRGSTCEGFLADLVRGEDGLAAALDRADQLFSEVATRSAALHRHREETFGRYLAMVQAGLRLPRPRYTPVPSPAPAPALPPLVTLAGALRSAVAADPGPNKCDAPGLLAELKARAGNIEAKLDILTKGSLRR